MQVTETLSEGLKREFKVIVPTQEVEKKLVEQLEEMNRKQIRLPGFRPGKVPLPMLRQRFGKAVHGEVVANTIDETARQALTDRGLRPAGQPKIDLLSADEGKDLEYAMTLELIPDIEPMDFSSLSLERLKIEVSDQEVMRALEQMNQQHKHTHAVTEDREARAGDVLVIDFKGSVGGETLPGMEAEDHHLELGSNSFIPGFEDQLIGAKAGESRTVTVTFPENYGNEKLAGKEAVFECKVKELREEAHHEIDEEFAQHMGEESLESLKGKLRDHLAQQHQQFARARLKRQLLDKLAEAHDFTVPESLVETEFNGIWRQVEEDRKTGQLDPEDEGKSEEELQAEYRKIAERRVRLGLLLAEVGRANHIEVAQEELNQALMREIQRYPGHGQEVLKFYRENPQAIESLRAPIFEDKVIDYIVDLAKVSERSVSFEEFEQEESAAGSEEAEAEGGEAKGSAGRKKGKKAEA